MKKDYSVEAIIIGVILSVAIFFAYTLFYCMDTKNRMCRDFGYKTYARELSWVECLVL